MFNHGHFISERLKGKYIHWQVYENSSFRSYKGFTVHCLMYRGLDEKTRIRRCTLE